MNHKFFKKYQERTEYVRDLLLVSKLYSQGVVEELIHLSNNFCLIEKMKLREENGVVKGQIKGLECLTKDILPAENAYHKLFTKFAFDFQQNLFTTVAYDTKTFEYIESISKATDDTWRLTEKEVPFILMTERDVLLGKYREI